MKLDKRVERNTKSAIELMAFLREVVRTPASFSDNDKVILALRSQGALAKFADKERGICSSSINTLKRIAESCIPGGFEAVDKLRASALRAVNAERLPPIHSKRVSKVDLASAANDLKADKARLLQDLARLTSAFQKSLKQGRNYAHQAAKQSVIALCMREQRELLDELSLMHNIPQNVLPISRG